MYFFVFGFGPCNIVRDLLEGHLNFKFCYLGVFNFVPMYFFVFGFGFGPCNIVMDHLSVHISVFGQVSTRHVTRR